MKKFILKWLGIDKGFSQHLELVTELTKIVARIEGNVNEHTESLENRRQEIDTVIETLQNLDNHDVIRDLHLRILELEKRESK